MSTRRRSPGAFVAWHPFSRRGHLLSEEFGLTFHLIAHRPRGRLFAPLRYFTQALHTLWLLLRLRPGVVVVQNPPLFAPLTVALYATLARAAYLIDDHSAALRSPIWERLHPLHAALSRRARGTIVATDADAAIVEAWGASAFVLPDIVRELPAGNTPDPPGRPFAVVVSSYSEDEPLGAVIEAAARLPELTVAVTGDPARSRAPLPAPLPSNVRLTGFLDDRDYLGLLRAADVVVALTTREGTMQRGGCEALALGKPLVTSDTALLRGFFPSGTLHVAPQADAIASGLDEALSRHEELAGEMVRLRERRRREWAETRAGLQMLLA